MPDSRATNMVVIPEPQRDAHAAHQGDVAPAAAAHLGWTDPETGEVLAIEVRGSRDFLLELLALGFEACEPRDHAASVDGADAGDRMGEPRAGANLVTLTAGRSLGVRPASAKPWCTVPEQSFSDSRR